MADIPATLTLGGVDVTAYVDARSLTLKNALHKVVDTLDFTLTDWDGGLGDPQPLEKEVCLYDELGSKLFGGYVKEVDIETLPIGGGAHRPRWQCKARDYTDLLLRGLVSETWVNQTDQAIIQAAVAAHAPGVDTSLVSSSGITFARLSANRITVVQLLDRLAQATGYEWYVGPDKKLRYFGAGSETAPFALSDTPNGVTTFAPINLVSQRTTVELANVVTVVGGKKRSTDQTFYLAGDGVATERLLPYPLHAPDGFTGIQVAVNTGTQSTPVWTARSVGIDNVDKLTTSGGTKDVLYNFNEKLLKFATAPPALPNAVRVIGQYEVPILARARSQASFDTYGAWYHAKVLDQSIRDDATAQAVARATLAERAFHKERLTFQTYQRGLRAGQALNVTDTTKGIDGQYLVLGVTLKGDGADRIVYSVEAGERNPDLVDLLLDIRRRQFEEPDDDAGSVVTELLQAGDALSLGDAASVTASTGPYRYSGATNDPAFFRWDMAKWA